MKNVTIQPYTIQLDSRRFTVLLHRQKRRTFRITVKPDLTVEAFFPDRIKAAEIDLILRKKYSWIIRKLNEVQQLRPLPKPLNYENGEIIYYLGQRYHLQVLPSSSVSVQLTGSVLQLAAGRGMAGNGKLKKMVEGWYRQRAWAVFSAKMIEFMRVVSPHGIIEPELAVRKMRRRWGSCHAKGKIILNLDLIKTPLSCIEYVIMHELCHLREPNHSHRFYSFLSLCQPDWQERKRELNRIRLG